ncbi:MAG: carbohydrate kinase family protein [Candidatus Bathyarchaeia archaeon]|jgi:fructokinase
MNQAKKIDCVVLGDVFFDIMIRQDPLKLSLIKGGTSYVPMKIEPGGIGNIAVGLKRLGGQATLIGKAGKDTFGFCYQDNLLSEGVNVKLIFDKFIPTGIITTFVAEDGERSFLVSRGANDFLSPEDVEKHKLCIQSAKCILLTGYSLVTALQESAIFKAVDIAKSFNVKIIFDIAAHNLVTEKRASFEKLVDSCDVLTLNYDEAKALTNQADLSSIAKTVCHRVPLVALRLGRAGCLMVTPQRTFKCAANVVQCVDSTGAGDAFVSALIYGLSKKFSIEQLAKLGNWYASYCVKNLGSRSFPNRAEIVTFFSSL